MPQFLDVSCSLYVFFPTSTHTVPFLFVHITSPRPLSFLQHPHMSPNTTSKIPKSLPDFLFFTMFFPKSFGHLLSKQNGGWVTVSHVWREVTSEDQLAEHTQEREYRLVEHTLENQVICLSIVCLCHVALLPVSHQCSSKSGQDMLPRDFARRLCIRSPLWDKE